MRNRRAHQIYLLAVRRRSGGITKGSATSASGTSSSAITQVPLAWTTVWLGPLPS